ncbi:4-hydroxyphenylpyruvate dioxygenase [Oscillatoria sp. FACHB-1406]|uniref:4-hydroxyphenylpyruvate dioxygenase n=1 Tax=Oscillatoria sp. FACHB-1406 TaxID=2692846 RepID=UPI0016890447|nr:4-hydroxyphenylpyruvate dioxygenase [Oscillatoria sp. FACHB-1406]MBD2579495.1 4-hydroxyphenylpyruvate dioxygenase [Oscillatoria sp. FACHB-1406]
MKIDRVCFYVDDAEKWRDWFARAMQFQAVGGGSDGQTRAEIVMSGEIVFVLCSPLRDESPVAAYLRSHPPGVAEVAFLVPDLDAALERAVAVPETRTLEPIQARQFTAGTMRWSTIVGRVPLRHTLVERRGITPILPEDWAIALSPCCDRIPAIDRIDHLVLNVAVGELERTARWYERALGFERQQTFAIQTQKSGLLSQVLVHPTSGVQIPANEPTSASSQIQEFLDFNGGAGVQHIALRTKSIIESICQLKRAGLSFLEVPPSYYDRVQQQHPQLNLSVREWEALARSQILIDPQVAEREKAPLLLQIFTQPIFPEPTFFFEFIERRDRARGFGEGNFRALFEAIEKEQVRRGTLNN